MTLRLLDTFSGIGGFSLAARWLGGFETVQFVEKEPWCHKVLSKHWPDVPIHDDITTYQGQPGSADVICGGFPCQDISIAGKKAGIKEGTRSGLFYQLMRVICDVRPRYVVLENVAAILDNAMLGAVLGELAQAGYDAEWACIPASAVGACHQRDRWWCVAYRARWDAGIAVSGRLRGERWRALGDVVGTPRAREADSQQWQRYGDAADDCGPTAAYPQDMLGHGGASEQRGKSGGGQIPELGNGHGADVAHADDTRLEGRQPASLRQCGEQWPPGTRDSCGQRLSSDWRSYVSEPVLCRGNDGLSGRVDRLKGLGNAVVPQVAMIPLARVLQMEGCRTAGG